MNNNKPKQRKSSLKEKPLRTSGPEFDRFIKSSIWYDMHETMKDRVEILQDLFLQASDMGTIKNIQGQIVAWKEMMKLPSYLKQCAHQEQSNKEPKNDE